MITPDPNTNLDPDPTTRRQRAELAEGNHSEILAAAGKAMLNVLPMYVKAGMAREAADLLNRWNAAIDEAAAQMAETHRSLEDRPILAPAGDVPAQPAPET